MRLTKREKVLLAFLIFALVMFGSYRYLITPQWEAIAEVEEEIAFLESELHKLENIVEVDERLTRNIADIRLEMKSISDNYFSLIEEQEEIILLLNEFMMTPGIEANSLSFSEPRIEEIEGTEAAIMGINVNYDGTYNSLLNLLRTIWQFDHKVIVSGVSMNAQINEGLGGSFQIDLYDLSPITGDEENMFVWLQEFDYFKDNPFEPVGADYPGLRYVFTDVGRSLVIDYEYTPFNDIEGHWAEEAINAFGEQRFVFGDRENNFHPNDYMTRGEVIILLDNILQWPMPDEPIDLTEFEDYSELGRYESAMARAIFKGYLSRYIVGYEDDTLRPNDPMTYEEFSTVIGKILEDETYEWRDSAVQILEETGYASPGIEDDSEFVTRAEAVYFLYNLDEEDIPDQQ